MHFTFNDATIMGFRPFNTSHGIDDERNGFVILQLEDTTEVWECECLYQQDLESINATMRRFLNWLADSGYCESHQLVRWFVMPTIGQAYNASWRISCKNQLMFTESFKLKG